MSANDLPMSAVAEPTVAITGSLQAALNPPAAQLPEVVSPRSPVAAAAQDNIVLLAFQRGATPEQIEKLMELIERQDLRNIERDKREAEKAFNLAFSRFKSTSVEIIKRRKVDYPGKTGQVKYKHAELADVMEAVTPALAENGFGFSYKTDYNRADDWVTVRCNLKHALGHVDSTTLGGPPDRSGNKSEIQAIHSAVTLLERITLKAVCGVSEKGDDTDGGTADAAGDARGGAAKQGKSDPPPPDPPTPLSFYPEEGFARNLASWAALVANGQKSADQIAATAKKRAPLSDEQMTRLKTAASSLKAAATPQATTA